MNCLRGKGTPKYAWLGRIDEILRKREIRSLKSWKQYMSLCKDAVEDQCFPRLERYGEI